MTKRKRAVLRATCLNCMDGRVQAPVLNWIRQKYNIDFVDVITEAGIDKIISSQRNIGKIVRSINISVTVNHSSRIFVVGHHDCRGNPVDKPTHQKYIMKAVERLKKRWPGFDITGLWINRYWQVEICQG